jgi:hypothetical protein
MTIDRYTKTILTVIALALATIAVRGLTTAASAMGSGCGASPRQPCYVDSSPPLLVRNVSNEPVTVKTSVLEPLDVRIAR